jgi:hypothetical protein
MGIPKTYYDGNPEDRRYVDDFWAWLKEQPQQAWLYYARCANWDEAERIFIEMVRQPECDRGLASWLFWSSDPTYYIANGKRPVADRVSAAILDRCEKGGFPNSRLHYGRVEVAFYALRVAEALERLSGPAPFRIPRELCASFDGSNPDLPPFDEETERDLAEMFTYLDGKLPRTDRDSWEPQHKGGNWWYEPGLRLPRHPIVTEQMTDVEAIDAVFGEHRSALRRIEQVRQKRNRPAARYGTNPDPKMRAVGLGLLLLSLIGLALVAWLHFER